MARFLKVICNLEASKLKEERPFLLFLPGRSGNSESYIVRGTQ